MRQRLRRLPLVVPVSTQNIHLERSVLLRAHCLCYSWGMNRVYEYRRHLPHYQRDNKAIFVTFSTHQRWTLPPDARTIVLESCTWGNGTRLNLHGAVGCPTTFI